MCTRTWNTHVRNTQFPGWVYHNNTCYMESFCSLKIVFIHIYFSVKGKGKCGLGHRIRIQGFGGVQNCFCHSMHIH